MTEERYTVIYSCDGNYWTHAFVSIFSLLLNNRDLAFDLFLLSDSPDELFFANLEFFNSVHPDVRLEWIAVQHEILSNAPLEIDYISVATYYRLLLGDVLPTGTKKVLYLDADTIVRGSIRDLLVLDVSDSVLAAVPAFFSVEHEIWHGTVACRLGLPEGTLYFNAGVLLINIERWRELDIGGKSLEYISRNAAHPEKFRYNDQDTLNVVLFDEWQPVGPMYNHVEFTVERPRSANFGEPTGSPGFQIPESGPAIVHFAFPEKPWNGGCPHPYASDYWFYRMQTPYADKRKQIRSKVVSAGWYLRRGVRRIVHRMPYGRSAIRLLKSLRS